MHAAELEVAYLFVPAPLPKTSITGALRWPEVAAAIVGILSESSDAMQLPFAS